jgi:hypothetical protein
MVSLPVDRGARETVIELLVSEVRLVVSHYTDITVPTRYGILVYLECTSSWYIVP